MNIIKKACLTALCSLAISTMAYAENDTSRVWIEFKPAGADNALTALQNAGAEIHYRFDDLNAFAATVPTAALKGLEHNPNINFVEEDAKRYPSAQTVPYGIDAIQARDVWDNNRDGVIDADAPSGNGITVCVIDSGVSVNHEDLSGVNIFDGHPSNWNEDSCGHGTHVAGTITAMNNNLGVVGVNPGNVSLFIVKVFDNANCEWTYSSTLVNAAQQCEDAGAKVINMSLGGPTRSRVEDREFKRLNNNVGILSIAAAGNDSNNTKSYPASYNSVVSVAAVDSNNDHASFSQTNNAVELSAPGVAVLSTVPWQAEHSVAVDGASYAAGNIEYSAEGDVTGPLVDGGLCDSQGGWSGDVVICERGNISFFDKVMNVQNGGGIAAVIYNNEPGNFSGTLGTGNSSAIPAISLSQQDGSYLVANKVGMDAHVVSTINTSTGSYEEWNGTSMATPHVTGAAALIWSSDPTLTNNDIRDALTLTAYDLGEPGRDSTFGFGLIQAYDAWDSLGGSGGGSYNQPPTATFTYTCTELYCSFDASQSSGNDDAIATYEWDFGDTDTATGINTSHDFTTAGTYAVKLTVTDEGNAVDTDTQNVTVTVTGGDTTAPVISNVLDSTGKGNFFTISWQTDEPSTTVVTFDCCGSYSDNALVTNHSMELHGAKKRLYHYEVSSTDAAGNTATEGGFTFQND